MSERITITVVNGHARAECRCGVLARVHVVETLGSTEPSYIAGLLHEPCRCPRCFSCNQLLDDERRCENLDCLNLGLIIPPPE